MTKIELAYLAGLVDGEGCIYVKQRREKTWTGYQLCLSISQGNEKDLEGIYNLIGESGYFRKLITPDHRAHSITYCCNTAYGILKAVEPYLRFKQEEAILGIWFQEKLRSRKDDETRMYKEMIWRRMKEIKQEKRIKVA